MYSETTYTTIPLPVGFQMKCIMTKNRYAPVLAVAVPHPEDGGPVYSLVVLPDGLLSISDDTEQTWKSPK
jgi:hypothetical protein